MTTYYFIFNSESGVAIGKTLSNSTYETVWVSHNADYNRSMRHGPECYYALW